jgi:EAL domain-containing protein (putative c-di-GMP-specific phosphodiesterase class I)
MERPCAWSPETVRCSAALASNAKLDRVMTRDIDSDPVRRALARALVAFGNEVGAEVIAEGIETEAELAVIIDIGIAYGQGFHLARPGSPGDLNLLLRAGGLRFSTNFMRSL